MTSSPSGAVLLAGLVVGVVVGLVVGVVELVVSVAGGFGGSVVLGSGGGSVVSIGAASSASASFDGRVVSADPPPQAPLTRVIAASAASAAVRWLCGRRGVRVVGAMAVTQHRVRHPCVNRGDASVRISTGLCRESPDARRIARERGVGRADRAP